MAKKLYGTDPDQVPTNADLGTMAYQDAERPALGQTTVKSAGTALIVERTSDATNLQFKADGQNVGHIYGFKNGDGGNLAFYPTNSVGTITQRMIINRDGNVTINTGNLVIGTSGSGIDFSATGNSSGTMTSELLDDYEEGTFTPNLTGTGGAFSGATYGTQSGKYTKIGDTVTVIVHIVASAVVGGSGSLAVGNLPFAANSACGAAIGYISGLNYDDSTYNQVGLYMTTSGGSRIIFTKSGDNVGASEILVSEFTSAFNCVFTATYKTAD